MVDFDDIEKMAQDRRRENFGKFKDTLGKVLEEQGSEMSADDLISQSLGKESNPKTTKDGGLSSKLMEAIIELRRETTDDSVDEIVLRAVGLYRSAVRHVLAGGTVQFVGENGEAKTLKVRVKQP